MKINGLPVMLCIFATLHSYSQPIPYRSVHDEWNPDSLGNHRAIVEFRGKGAVAKLFLNWRLNIDSMDKKRIIIQDAKTGQPIRHQLTGLIDNERAEIYFEPVSGPGLYYIYYLPYKNEGRSNYPRGVYLHPVAAAEDEWSGAVSKAIAVNCRVVEFQSINEFNSFYPMEVVATRAETHSLVSKSKGKSFLVFPEDRTYPIRMKTRLPYRWIQGGNKKHFTGVSAKGAYYCYQLGIYALENLRGLKLHFEDLNGPEGSLISGGQMNCINLQGVDYAGKPFDKEVDVDSGQVQGFWCGIDIPKDLKSGKYKGYVSVSAKGNKTEKVSIQIEITLRDTVLENGAAAEPKLQSRLKWLNSTLAQDNSVIAPYSALEVSDQRQISLLGRKMELGEDGFPKAILTYFNEEMTGFSQSPKSVLASPIRFVNLDKEGKKIEWKPAGLVFTRKDSGTVSWTSRNRGGKLEMEVRGSIEFDGFVVYKVRINALEDYELKDIYLEIPYTDSSSIYLMGLGQKGGIRPASFDWKWDVMHKNQDGAWLGDVNGGMQFSLRDEKYIRPLNTNFYLQKPLILPSSWGNDNKGGIRIEEEGNKVLVICYSGARYLKKGDSLHFDFNLLITPFHPINTEFQWNTRFYHKYENLDTVKASGATIVNIHHATPINPWINYPFIEYGKMKAYIDEAHSKGLKVKIYNTVRELSDHAYELFVLRSLGNEIYTPGKGGGFSWLQEHVVNDYIAAWFVPEIKDAALINSGISRWHNYYVEGMNWLVQNVGIDGIYLDDVAFDRTTMKRIKRVLTQDGHPGIIDMHSANQFNRNDGFNNSANLYMEHFPYLNRLWFGEYFDYKNNEPDFFLTEVSGIPFGLMGEMLQDGGNPWRGMIYGMTNRYPWTEDADPRPIWKFWDAFGMKGTEMIGYWSKRCPVRTDHNKVLATVYKKEGTALVAIASWESGDVDVKLDIDWKQLGIDPAKANITAEEISNFQPARIFQQGQLIPVEKGKGWLLVISQH
jgi:hypothetical protein